MKVLIQSFVFFIIALPSLGQENEKSFWKEYIDKDVKELKLQDFEKIEVNTAIRIWNSYQAIELINGIDSTYKGKVVNFVAKVNGKEEQNGIKSQTLAIPETVIKTLIQQILNENVNELPDSHDVKGYVNGLDGTTYVFEVKTNGKFRIFSYWEPENNHYQNSNINEVKRVRNILSSINKQFDTWKLFERFRDSLPSGTYRYGGIILTKK